MEANSSIYIRIFLVGFFNTDDESQKLSPKRL